MRAKRPPERDYPLPERRGLGELPREQASAARARPEATVHARDRHEHSVEAHADAAATPPHVGAQTVAIEASVTMYRTTFFLLAQLRT